MAASRIPAVRTKRPRDGVCFVAMRTPLSTLGANPQNEQFQSLEIARPRGYEASLVMTTVLEPLPRSAAVRARLTAVQGVAAIFIARPRSPGPCENRCYGWRR